MDTVNLCPHCMEEIVEMGRNGYGRCNDPLHGWVQYIHFALLQHTTYIPSHKTRLDSITPKGTKVH